MEKYNWKSNINLNIFMLRVMGLWPKNDSTHKKNLYILHTLNMVILFIFGHIFFQLINLYYIRNDLKALAGTSYILLVELLGASKAYFLIQNSELLNKLLEILDSDLFQPKNKNQEILIESSVSFWRNIYKTFLIMCIGSDLFWAAFPFLDGSIKENRLPFLAWYPYNYKESPFYELTYFYQIIGISFLTMIHLNVDTLIAAFNVYTGCQFDMLRDNLRKFGDENSDSDTDFIECVEHHKQILNFVDYSNRFCNWILFLQFFISGVSIGITMFQLTLVKPLSNEFYSLLSYGVAIIVEIFMYCWFGNEVELKSNQLSYAIFESNWLELSPKFKKNLVFFTMNLTKPTRPSAFNLFYLSLQTFVTILKTAWSYFALLNQLNS